MSHLRMRTVIAIIATVVGVSVTPREQTARAQSGSEVPAIDSMSEVEMGNDPIPGVRNCFWRYGPFSGDPYLNIAYPDAATAYWASAFTIPKGARLEFEGEFPHSRYMSFISYNGAGVPIESVADYLIKPADGSTNPFVSGADRTTLNRSYSLEVVDAAPSDSAKTGMNLVGVTRDSIAAPHYGSGQQAILYRIYVADRGTDQTGGVGLPEAVLTLSDGKVLKGADACRELRTKQPLQLDAAALAVPMTKYYELLAAAAKMSPYHPAADPPVWYVQLDREALYDIYTGEPLDPNAPKSTGGFYPNLDNQYIRTILNRKLGKVFIITGKAPTTPRTVNGDAEMGTGELRYWSFCSNQGFANTRVNDCVYDESVPLSPAGYYTIVVSRAADRPRNAIPQCGVAWLPMADDGDGAVDPDVTVLQLRNMLGTVDFSHAVQSISKPGEVEEAMAEYYPRGRYMTTSAFEVGVPCLIGAE